MFKSAAEEIGEWADQCRSWAKGARTREQRSTLMSLQKLLQDAALEADDAPDGPSSNPLARPRS
jgi:hypothetical protein